MKLVLRRAWYPALALLLLVLSVKLLVTQSRASDWHDFDVFYGAASAALAGKSVYIIVGQYNLPFWYPPWIAWFFIPFAVWPKQIGLLIYQALSIVSAVLGLSYLARSYRPGFSFLDQLVVLAFLVPMSLQLVMVGQMEYIFLGLLVVAIWAAVEKKPALGGIIFAFLLAKPHLIVPFSVFLFLRLGRRGVLAAALTLTVMLAMATFLYPGWYLEMAHLLSTSGLRTDGLPFTTLPSLLGGRENWIGTGNLPFTIVLMLAAILVLWKLRSLSTVPLLSLALALSLLCAPRAYAYDLPLLIPALVWVTAGRFRTMGWLWAVVGLVPVALGFSPATYILTLLVCALAVRKAAMETWQAAPSAVPGQA